MINVTINEVGAPITVQVDNLRILKVNRKTQAQLITAATAGGLIANEIYFITDTNKIAYALTASTYSYIEAEASTSWGGVSGTLSNQTDLQNALNAKAASSHTHSASAITDFDTEVSNNTDVSANTSARHTHSNFALLETYTQPEADLADAVAKKHLALTVTDSSEINFTLTGQDLTANIIAGSIDETKLDVSTNLSLDLADTAVQPAALAGYEPVITGAGANTVWHGNKVFSAVVEADISLSDNTTNDVSTVRHGFMSKLPGGTTVFYRGDGTFAAPSGATVPNAYIIEAFTNTSYNLVHNLGSYPVVQVLDNTGAVVVPLSIVNNTANDLTVTFTTSGTYTILATLGSPQLQEYTSTAVNYSALVTDRIIEATASGVTITLPTANVSNAGYEYKLDNSSSGNISVVGQGGELIQNQLTQVIPPDSCMSVYANGTAWRIN